MATSPASKQENKDTIRLKPSWRPPYWSRLDAYIFSEVHYPFFLAMLVYNGIFLIQILSEVSQIGSGQFTIPTRLFVLVFLSRIPDILPLTSALSFLSGTLFAMRRMSADSEIIAPQSLGLSFWRVNRALFLYGFLLALVNATTINFLGPDLTRKAKAEYQRFIEFEAFPNINEGINQLSTNAVMYVDRVEEGMLAGMMILNRKDEEEEIYLARRASLFTNREVHLVDWTMCTLPRSWDSNKDIRFLDGKSLARQIPVPTNFGKDYQQGERSELDTFQMWAEVQTLGDQVPPERLYALYQRVFSPLLFPILAMLAIPLAARHHRQSSGSGIGWSLLVIGVHFVLTKVSGDLVEEGRLTPELAVALPLGVLFVIGLVLQIGKNLWWSQYLRKSQGRISYAVLRSARFVGRQLVRLWRLVVPAPNTTSRGAAQTFVFPSKLDLYTIKSFFSILIMVQLSFLLLFVLIEYIQISDSIRNNQIRGEIVLAFFLNKLPNMVDETLFISLLIAILLLFTFMSKNQEIVAIRAGGGSMQRLCLPLVFCGMLVSGSAFYLENMFLPNTNRTAQILRNKIRNKSETMFTRDVWMRTKEGVILNYTHYDDVKSRLVDVTRYRIEGDPVRTIERTSWPILEARGGAVWKVDVPTKAWRFHFNGRLVEKVERLEIAKDTMVDLGFDLSELRHHKRKASEFSIHQLREYLNYLEKLGYVEGHYRTELYIKYAKPLVPLFMMLLAMPLGIQVGRRGTFFGVAIGFGAGLSFLGFFELCKELGSSGTLNPLVAGWSVVVVYGFVALYRFINLE